MELMIYIGGLCTGALGYHLMTKRDEATKAAPCVVPALDLLQMLEKWERERDTYQSNIDEAREKGLSCNTMVAHRDQLNACIKGVKKTCHLLV